MSCISEDNSTSTRFIIPNRSKSAAKNSSNPHSASIIMPRRAVSPVNLGGISNTETKQSEEVKVPHSVQIQTSNLKNQYHQQLQNQNVPLRTEEHIGKSRNLVNNENSRWNPNGIGAPPLPSSVKTQARVPSGRNTAAHINVAPSPAGGAIRSAAMRNNRNYVTPNLPPASNNKNFGTYSVGNSSKQNHGNVENFQHHQGYSQGYHNNFHSQPTHFNPTSVNNYYYQHPQAHMPSNPYYYQQPYQPPNEVPDVGGRPNYKAMSEDEKAESKRRLLDKISILKRKFPNWNINSPPESMSPDYIHDIYEDYVIQIRSHSRATQYKIGLVITVVLIELGVSYFLKFNISGYAMSQLTHMYRYEDVLLELGEKYSATGTGEPYSPETRLIFALISQTIVFIVAKTISEWCGSSEIAKLVHEVYDGMVGGDDTPSSSHASGIDSDGIPIAPGTEDDIAMADGISDAAGKAAESRSNVPRARGGKGGNVVGDIIGSFMNSGGGGGFDMGSLLTVATGFANSDYGKVMSEVFKSGGSGGRTNSSSFESSKSSPTAKVSPVRSPPVFSD